MFKISTLFKSDEDRIYEEFVKLKALYKAASTIETNNDPVMEEMKATQLSILQNNYAAISRAFRKHCKELTPNKSQTLFNMRGSKPRVSWSGADFKHVVTHLPTNSDISITTVSKSSYTPIIALEENFTMLDYSKLRRDMFKAIDKLNTSKIIKRVTTYALNFKCISNAPLVKDFILHNGTKDLKSINDRYNLVRGLQLTCGLQDTTINILPKTIVNIDFTDIPKHDVVVFLQSLNITHCDFLI